MGFAKQNYTMLDKLINNIWCIEICIASIFRKIAEMLINNIWCIEIEQKHDYLYLLKSWLITFDVLKYVDDEDVISLGEVD